MPNSALRRETVCPKCGKAGTTTSPSCHCYSCHHEWSIDWQMTPEEFQSINSSKKALKIIGELANRSELNPRALRTVFNTRWSLDGKEGTWINFCQVPAEELAHAQAHGLMKDSYLLSHDDLIEAIRNANARIDRRDAAAAFIASLLNRRLDWRSVLGSCAHALHLQPHPLSATGDRDCSECGYGAEVAIQFNHCLFRRLMWAGNVEQGDPGYILCDLNWFGPTKVKATDEAKKVLAEIFERIRNLPAKAGLSDLEKSIAGLFPSNKGERQVLLEILGSCGILKPKESPSRHLRWLRPSQLPQPQHFYRKEWRSPVNCWTGVDGVNEEAVEFWFGAILRERERT